MHDHDVDLILSLAEGDLSDEQAKAAEAELAACPQCSVELAAQRAALEAMHAAPRVELTAAERDLLHRELRRELRLDPEQTAAVLTSRRARWLAPLAGIATAAALVLAVVVVLPRNGDDALPVAATAAPEQASVQEPAPTEEVAGDSPGTAEAPSLQADQAEPTTTTMQAAGSAVSAAALTDDETELFNLGPEDTVDVAAFGTELPTLEELATHLDGSEPIYSLASKARTLAPATEELDYAALNSCASVGLEFFPAEDTQVYSSTVATGDLDGKEVVVVSYATGPPTEDGLLDEPSSEVLVTLDPETCEILDTYPSGP